MSSGQDIQAIIQALSDANAVRYFTAIGVVCMLYDHAITFQEEVRCIWTAPNSFPKYAFLLNRYLVPIVLIAILHETCGLGGNVYGDNGCRLLLSATSMLSVLSVCLDNMLALLRVLVLWKENKTMRCILYATYALGTVGTLFMMSLTVVSLGPGIRWSSEAGMCMAETSSRYLGATWGAPIIFELHVIAVVVYNTIATPRSENVRLTQALQRDGLIFFIVVLLLRQLNLILAIAARPSLTILSAFFVWATVTMVINRSLLRLRSAEIKDFKRNQLPFHCGRNPSPFGFPGGNTYDEEDEDQQPPKTPHLHFSLHLPVPPRDMQLLQVQIQATERPSSRVSEMTCVDETWNAKW